MKNLFLLLLVVLLAGCAPKDQFTLKFNLKDGAGQKVLLQKPEGRELVTIDSVLLDDAGKGELTGKIDIVEILYLTVETEKSVPNPVFLDNGVYKVSGRADSLEFAGKGLVMEFVDYNKMMNTFSEEARAISRKLRDVNRGGNPDDVAKLYAAYDSLEMEWNRADSVYIADHTASHVSVYLLMKQFYEMNSTQLEEALGRLDESVHNSKYYQFMDEKLKALKRVAIGEPYVDFSLPQPDGETLELSTLIGENVLMIDFWASWCNPCRRANPEVVRMYNEYHEKGFDILGVSLDRDREAWLKAIEDDGLVWHQVSDLKFWESEGAALYAVSSIPATVLIDRKGVIRARNLRGPALAAMVDQLVNE